MGPADLHTVLEGLPTFDHPDLLVGAGTFDDAGVFRISPDTALVQTVDFFTPVVDDPFDFGRVAAANALSDVYAMGARPITALAVCAFPVDLLPLETLRATLAGGLAVLAAEGVTPLGGHTVKGPEFTYGLAVTGVVHPDRILANRGARAGDVLVLTKPLGTGVLSTALKRGLLGAAGERMLIATMAATNRAAAEACAAAEVHALTDVTGYGLLGHALEMASASGVGLELDAPRVPLLAGALDAVRAGAVPGGLRANRTWAAASVEFVGVDEDVAALLTDPQTSGGLLVALAPGACDSYLAACAASGVQATVIGCVVAGRAGTAVVRG